MRRLKISVSLWLCLLVLTSPAVLCAQQTHASPNQPTTQAPAKAGDGWIGKQFARERPIYQGALSGLSKKTVMLPDKRTLTVGELGRSLFADQQRLEAELKRAPAGSLLGAVKVEEVGYEYAHAYVLTRTVSVVVADPSKLRQGSPTFSRIAPKAKGQMTLKELKPEALQRFFKAKAGLLADEPGAHPLRLAAAKGDQALLDAVVDGAGELSVSDSFMILKVSAALNAQGQLLAPPFGGGVYDLSKRAPIAGQLARPTPEPLVLPATQRSSGVTTVTSQHLNGFTYGHDWFWERRWEFFSGHVWLAAGLAYGFGLRMPIELKARMTPNAVATTGSTDQPSRFEVEVSAQTLDGGATHFTQAGLGQPLRRNGEEFLLFAELGYGYSFEALWMSFGYREYSTYGFDFSQHFKPPQGGAWSAIKEYFIPAEVTRTKLDLGVVKGQLELGVRLDGRGWVDVVVKLLHKGQAQLAMLPNGQGGTAHTLRLEGADKPIKLSTSLGLGEPGETTFGFLIDQIKYTVELSLLPGVRYGVTIGYSWLSKSFSDTLWFESLRVPLPSLTLGTHEGTRAEVRYEGGEKTYRRTAAD
jgi:hypothetical protein